MSFQNLNNLKIDRGFSLIYDIIFSQLLKSCTSILYFFLPRIIPACDNVITKTPAMVIAPPQS